MSDPVDLMERTFTATGRVVANVKPDQLGDSTPCTEWTVRDLINHLLGTADLFGAAARGEKSDINPFGMPEDILGDGDIASAYDERAKSALQAWRDRGLDGTVTLSVGETPAQVAATICVADQLMHGWDLAKATGQLPDYDDESLDASMAFTGKSLGASARGEGKAFGPVVEVPDDAPKMDRYAAWLGRTP
jgi:uncharacterized protein (TIGR03086 family)